MIEEVYIASVCENIKRIRIEKNLSQSEFSAVTGIDAANIRRIESGRTAPTLRTLFRIAQTAEIDIRELIPTSIDK